MVVGALYLTPDKYNNKNKNHIVRGAEGRNEGYVKQAERGARKE